MMNDYLFNHRLRQVFWWMVILALTGLIILKLEMFIPGILGAITLYILSRDVFFYFTHQKRWRADAVSFLLIAVFFYCYWYPNIFSNSIING